MGKLRELIKEEAKSHGIEIVGEDIRCRFVVRDAKEQCYKEKDATSAIWLRHCPNGAPIDWSLYGKASVVPVCLAAPPTQPSRH